MKKTLALAAVLAFCSTSVLAADNNGFVGESLQQDDFYAYTSEVGTAKVAELKNHKDGMRVNLQGMLVKHLGGMHYVFKDDTGMLNVEIKRSAWNGMKIKPTEKIEIEGTLNKHRVPMEVRVDEINKL